VLSKRGGVPRLCWQRGHRKGCHKEHRGRCGEGPQRRLHQEGHYTEPRRKGQHGRHGEMQHRRGRGDPKRSKHAVAGRLRHRPHLNGTSPRVVRSGHGRGSGGLVALVLPLVL
jgi:hypothetical protein